MRAVWLELNRMRTHMHTPEFAGESDLGAEGGEASAVVRPYPHVMEFATTVWHVVAVDLQGVSEPVQV